MISMPSSNVKKLSVLAEHIKAKATDLDENVDKKLESLAGFARQAAESGYEFATAYGIKKTAMPKVTIEPVHDEHGDGWLVTADGKEVMFLEFGAGIAADPQHPWSNEMPFRVEPGSWSEDHAKQFSEKGYWFYDKTSWSYIPATRAMYNASLAVRQKIESGEWLNDEVNGA